MAYYRRYRGRRLSMRRSRRSRYAQSRPTYAPPGASRVRRAPTRLYAGQYARLGRDRLHVVDVPNSSTSGLVQYSVSNNITNPTGHMYMIFDPDASGIGNNTACVNLSAYVYPGNALNQRLSGYIKNRMIHIRPFVNYVATSVDRTQVHPDLIAYRAIIVYDADWQQQQIITSAVSAATRYFDMGGLTKVDDILTALRNDHVTSTRYSILFDKTYSRSIPSQEFVTSVSLPDIRLRLNHNTEYVESNTLPLRGALLFFVFVHPRGGLVNGITRTFGWTSRLFFTERT